MENEIDEKVLAKICFQDAQNNRIFLTTTRFNRLKHHFKPESFQTIGDTVNIQGKSYVITKISVNILDATNPNDRGVDRGTYADEQEIEANPFNLAVIVQVEKVH